LGVLGIVSLLTMSKTSQLLALQHTRAVTLSDAIVERIRANPAGLAIYNTGTDAPVGGNTIKTEPTPDCRTAKCSADQLATHDMWAWEQALDGAAATVAGANTAGLFEPRGCIAFTAAPGLTRTGQLTVYIQWRGLTRTFDAVQDQDGEQICGGKDAGTDEYRRQVVVNTYVLDAADL
jgi:type IV pilus assembly protein PilV